MNTDIDFCLDKLNSILLQKEQKQDNTFQKNDHTDNDIHSSTHKLLQYRPKHELQSLSN